MARLQPHLWIRLSAFAVLTASSALSLANATVDWTVPTYITNTRYEVSAHVTTLPTSGDVSIAHLKLSIVEAGGDVVLDFDDMPHGGDPVATAPAWAAIDTLQYGHNQTVQFKLQIWMFQVGGGERELAPVYRTVTTWNHKLVASDPTAVQSGEHANAVFYLETMKYAGNDLPPPGNWDQAAFLAKLRDRTCVVICTHGGITGNEGFQRPPDPEDGDIYSVTVTATLASNPNSVPILQFALLSGCEAGGSPSYAWSFLSESASTKNRAVIGFKVVVLAGQAAEFILKFMQECEAGYTAFKAARRAYDAITWPAGYGDQGFLNVIAYYGDPAKRLRWLYDGNVDTVHQIWKISYPYSGGGSGGTGDGEEL